MSTGRQRKVPLRPEEYEQLLARLDEAEGTLSAIREGEVDALLIRGRDGDRVYTVTSADEPYRILVEQMQEGAVTLTAEGAVLYCNPRFAEMVRTAPDRIIGKDMHPFISAGDRKAFAALLRESAGGSGRQELWLRAADGTSVPVYLSGNAMMLGDVRCLCLVITDLTERKRAEEIVAAERMARTVELEQANRRLQAEIDERRQAEKALKESEARNHAFFHHSAECLFVVAVTADGRFLYEGHNPRSESVLGISSDQVRGKSAEEFLPREAARNVVEAFKRCRASGRPHQYEETLELSSGSRVYDVILVPVRDDHGNIAKILGSARDMTEQRALAEALRQSQKIEAVGQLTSGVAHDFNNLLTAVLGNLDIIERRVKDPGVTRVIRGATRAAERGSRLTEQLLAFSRKQHLLPKPMDVNQIVTGMGDLLRSTIGAIINIERVLKPDLWPALLDPNQIELVILNLAINARDAMPLGGTITIETSNIRLGGPERPGDPAAGEYVAIVVSDIGTGMSPEVQAKAFEPFFTTKEPGKGSGLGLPMVYGVVSQLGGGIRLQSRPGQGTSVTLYLPRANAGVTGRALEPAPPVIEATGDATILIVDDDSDVRETTTTLLESLGYRVMEAQSGGGALEILESGKALDLMLVDFAMPGMNGAELIKRARAKRPALPMLLATGYADASRFDAGLSDEMIVKKPYRLDDLAVRVREALGQRAASRTNVLPLHPPSKKSSSTHWGG